MPDQFVPFLAVVLLLTLTPGPDMALVLRNGIRGGASLAWWTGLGCCTGIAGYAAASAIGLAAVLATSATAFTVIKLAGAAYLVYLGVMALLHARRPAPDAAAPAAEPGPALSREKAFRQGLMSNLLNPKIALIFLTLIPQFVSSASSRSRRRASSPARSSRSRSCGGACSRSPSARSAGSCPASGSGCWSSGSRASC